LVDHHYVLDHEVLSVVGDMHSEDVCAVMSRGNATCRMSCEELVELDHVEILVQKARLDEDEENQILL